MNLIGILFSSFDVWKVGRSWWLENLTGEMLISLDVSSVVKILTMFSGKFVRAYKNVGLLLMIVDRYHSAFAIL